MKKNKKLGRVALGILAASLAVSFVSCGALSGLLGGDEETTTNTSGQAIIEDQPTDAQKASYVSSAIDLLKADNFIPVTATKADVGAALKGKTAYLVKVHTGISSNPGKVEASKTGKSRSAEYVPMTTEDRCYTIPMEERGDILADTGSRAAATEYNVGDKRKFHMPAENGGNVKATTEGILKAKGEHCYVWYIPSKTDSLMNYDGYGKMQETFDKLYTYETEIFGKVANQKIYSNIIRVTGDERVNILMYDIDGDASEDKKDTGTFGFFDNVNVFTADSDTGKKYNSNGDLILHIDAWLAKNMPKKIMGTCAHEFQHMINYFQKDLNFDTWFTEMLSMISEETFKDYLGLEYEHTPEYFRSNFYLTGYNYGFSAESWTYITKTLEYGGSFDYGNTWLFATFLARNYGGVKLIHEIATNKYIREEAITQAIKAMGYTNETFYSALLKYSQIFANSDNADGFATINTKVSDTFGSNPKAYTYYAIKLKDKEPKDGSGAFTFLANKRYAVSKESLVNDTYATPYIYKPTAQVDLLPYGVSVHELGTVGDSGSSYNFDLPTSSDVKMFIMVK